MEGVMRVNAYIDGYNLYDAEKKLNDNRLKWLNLRALCQHFCDNGDKLDKVYYFTAYANYHKDNPDKAYKIENHRKYINDFLKGFGVTTKLGKFNKYKKEKQTDINIALQLYEDAIYNRFDKAFLVTTDTDFVAVINKIKENNDTKNKQIIILAPQENNIKSFFEKADEVIYLQRKDFAEHLLPKYGKNGAMMPIYNLLATQSEKQSAMQIDYAKKISKDKPFPPPEFPRCPKCKDYLSYESYEKTKNA